MSDHSYICITIIIISVLALYKHQSMPANNDTYTFKSHFLLSAVLIGLFLNIVVSLLVGDPSDAMTNTWRPDHGKFWYDMGATSIGWYLYELQSLHSGSDSWWYMAQAIEEMRKNPNSSVYKELFFNQHIKFQYPTSSLILLDAFQTVTGFSWKKTYETLNIICFLLIPLIGYLFYKIFYNEIIQQSDGINRRLVGILLSLIFVALFYPLVFSLYLGQIQSVILVLVTITFILFIHKKKWWAGLLLGMCATIKPQWLVILLWAALRKEWQLFWGAAIGASILFALSIALYGLHNLLEYQSVLTHLSKHGESYYLNQSMNGLMHRTLMNGINTVFKWQSIPPYNAIVYFSTLISSIILIMFSLFWRVKESPNIVDFSIVILCLTIASPVAWNHHYVVLLPILAATIPLILGNQLLGKFTYPILLFVVCLISQNFEGLTNQLASSAWNFLQSILYFSGLIILFLLAKLSCTQKINEDLNYNKHTTDK
jgi:alpha-1,2-mannosyltransferase